MCNREVLDFCEGLSAALRSVMSLMTICFYTVNGVICRQGLGGLRPNRRYCGWVPIYVTGYISVSSYASDLVFSVWSCPLCNCLVKKINQGTDVLTHNCLPPLLALCVLKHVCTRLIILTRGKNNHKIKIAVASWHSAFGIHPFDCEYTNILIVLTARIGGRGVCEKVGPVVKRASRYY